ncbi:MAG: histidine kinase [Solirubrobacterales bacterium]|nr:histidine kinase [Solirubrobacterales bacterium]
MSVRGRHRVLLGMAPGVGKTYRMLQEGRAEAAEGHDVVIGYLEPHDRPETAAQAEGLEMVPRSLHRVGTTVLPEMNLQAVIDRAPEVALVDELAHTNAQGSVHEKRYQDVEDLLDAGISVISTVNVQHLESLNDQLADLTGVRVRETLPDDVLKRADEIVLIDLTPQDLIERLREGKVYALPQVEQALGSFFRAENLAALREVALRQVAEDVESRRLVTTSTPIRGQPETRRSLAFGESMLALITPDPRSQRLIRRAWRSARRLGAELDLLWVAPPSLRTPETDPRLVPLRRLASILGVELIVEPGDDLVQKVSEVARRRGTTYVLMGPPTVRRGPARLRTSLVERMIEAMPGVDIRIVSDRSRLSEPGNER